MFAWKVHSDYFRSFKLLLLRSDPNYFKELNQKLYSLEIVQIDQTAFAFKNGEFLLEVAG